MDNRFFAHVPLYNAFDLFPLVTPAGDGHRGEGTEGRGETVRRGETEGGLQGEQMGAALPGRRRLTHTLLPRVADHVCLGPLATPPSLTGGRVWGVLGCLKVGQARGWAWRLEVES